MKPAIVAGAIIAALFLIALIAVNCKTCCFDDACARRVEP